MVSALLAILLATLPPEWCSPLDEQEPKSGRRLMCRLGLHKKFTQMGRFSSVERCRHCSWVSSKADAKRLAAEGELWPPTISSTTSRGSEMLADSLTLDSFSRFLGGQFEHDYGKRRVRGEIDNIRFISEGRIKVTLRWSMLGLPDSGWVDVNLRVFNFPLHYFTMKETRDGLELATHERKSAYRFYTPDSRGIVERVS